MSNIGMHKMDYNFFSSSMDSKRSARKKGIILVLMIILYLVLIAGVYLLLEFAIQTSRDQINSIESYLSMEEVSIQWKMAEERKQEIENLKQYSDSLNSFYKNIQQKDTIGTEYIKQITSAIPQGLYFDNLSMTSDHLQIQGTAPSRKIIAEYLSNMQALDLFKDVHVSNITTISLSADANPEENSLEATNVYSFIMDCQLKDVMEE